MDAAECTYADECAALRRSIRRVAGDVDTTHSAMFSAPITLAEFPNTHHAAIIDDSSISMSYSGIIQMLNQLTFARDAARWTIETKTQKLRVFAEQVGRLLPAESDFSSSVLGATGLFKGHPLRLCCTCALDGGKHAPSCRCSRYSAAENSLFEIAANADVSLSDLISRPYGDFPGLIEEAKARDNAFDEMQVCIDKRLTSAQLSGYCIRCHPYTQGIAMTDEEQVRSNPLICMYPVIPVSHFHVIPTAYSCTDAV